MSMGTYNTKMTFMRIYLPTAHIGSTRLFYPLTHISFRQTFDGVELLDNVRVFCHESLPLT